MVSCRRMSGNFFRVFIAFAIFRVGYPALKKTLVEIDRINVCPGNENMRYSIRDLSFNRVNTTHSALSLKVSFLDDIGDNLWFQILLDRWTSGGWANVPFITHKNPCKICLQYFPKICISYFEALGVRRPIECPIPKGNYTLENYLIPMQKLQVPMWKGKFRVKILWTPSKKSEDIYYCLEMGATSEEEI